ncbi:hypothetical protein AW19_4143 (plasmid) [Yersinia frederiksenii Y225]|nr:hypothetical protein AW19_4143 [Yersinia frederiksenii Y225]
MEQIFCERINKGNKSCFLKVFHDIDGYHLCYSALSRTNPSNKMKRERFTIFDETYSFPSTQFINKNVLPINAKNEKFRPLAECFDILTDKFLSTLK